MIIPRCYSNYVQEFWFKQDGGTSLPSPQRNLVLLQEQFGEKVVSRNGTVKYPARVGDLTLRDFWLWG